MSIAGGGGMSETFLQKRSKVKSIAAQINERIPGSEPLYAIDPDYQPFLFYIKPRIIYMSRLDDLPLTARYVLIQPEKEPQLAGPTTPVVDSPVTFEWAEVSDTEDPAVQAIVLEAEPYHGAWPYDVMHNGAANEAGSVQYTLEPAMWNVELLYEANHGAVTELAKGRTLDEADAITEDEVSSALGKLPAGKLHCSAMAIDALRASIENHVLRCIASRAPKHAGPSSMGGHDAADSPRR